MSTATLKRNSIEPPFLRIVNKYVSLSFTDFHESHQVFFSILLEKPVWDKSLSIFFDIVFFFFPPFSWPQLART